MRISTFQVIEAQTAEHFEQFLGLLREYATTNAGLLTGTLSRDLTGLIERYRPPQGRALLVLSDGELVGCGAVSRLTDEDGELKRMFVRPEYRGKGVGRAIVQYAIEVARKAGYQRLVLSTFIASVEARNLYQTLGFRAIAPFKETPLKDLMFMGMELDGAETGDDRRETAKSSVPRLSSPVVFKVSGNDLDDPAFSRRLAELIAAQANAGTRPILVHGGGKEITELLGALKIESRFMDGLRVTDGPTRDVALMVMSGLANKRMVAHLLAVGANAIGLSGVDANLLRVERINEALQFVGKPVAVNTALLQGLLAQGLVPVISPASLDMDNEICNVNADHAAGAIADALDASLLTFITNVPGVLDANKVLLPTLSGEQAEALIADGTIHSGMIPKVRTCLEALAAGVSKVRITNLDGVASDSGTVFEAA